MPDALPTAIWLSSNVSFIPPHRFPDRSQVLFRVFALEVGFAGINVSFVSIIKVRCGTFVMPGKFTEAENKIAKITDGIPISRKNSRYFVR
jgi:hypothetical protein